MAGSPNYEVERRGSHYHITLFLLPNIEPIGFLRLTQSEYDEIQKPLECFYNELASAAARAAPRITSG